MSADGSLYRQLQIAGDAGTTLVIPQEFASGAPYSPATSCLVTTDSNNGKNASYQAALIAVLSGSRPLQQSGAGAELRLARALGEIPDQPRGSSPHRDHRGPTNCRPHSLN